MTIPIRSADQALKKAAALTRKGDRTGAEALYEAILERFPENRRAADALAALRTARPKTPVLDRATAESVLGLWRSGRTGEALARAQSLLVRFPDTAFLHTICGACHAAGGAHALALEAHRHALALAPDVAGHHNNVGDALNTLGHHGEAVAHLERALALQPDYPEALNNLGSAMIGLNKPLQAIAFLEKALALRPGFAEALNNLGIALSALGRNEEAVARYRAALQARPDYAQAWRNLANEIRFGAGDPSIAIMENALAAATNGSDRMHLAFALGKALDDSGDPARAFAFFADGNRIARNSTADVMAEHHALLARIRGQFAAGMPAAVEAPPGPRRPVFIVGMPRSGTSLAEQILASHADVYGAGELQALRLAVAPALAQAGTDPDGIAAIRRSYLDQLAALDTDRPVVVDKMPLNFRWIGHAAAALPEAVFIHTRRDAVATGWSIFRTFFPARGLEFSFDLADIAAYTRLHDDLMAFWKERLPGRIHELDYEALTENQEAQTRRLLDICGLPWDDACLRFHETGRSVRTASAAQVRQPLYRGSSQAWRKYEPWLGPLIDALA